ncbi:MAG: biopolymer transporter ExbD [Bdellovibrionales bacterium]|jgi:biopolymer transport protein ExbD|nr:biopolymer transporter ExbD [Bdellovibrionales bacterium]
MFDLDATKGRESVIRLQLAPMIDIFVLVIVFLLKGTVMTETVISNPELVDVAKSESREVTELAPEVYITETEVHFRMIEEVIPLARVGREELDLADPLIEKFKNYLAQSKGLSETGNALMHVNVVADYRTPYKTLFHVVRLLRAAGFKAMLFIAEGDAS